MSYRISVVSVAMVVVLATGCDQAATTVVGPDLALSSQLLRSDQTVPFKTNNYSFNIIASVPEASCDGDNRVYLAGEGTATHLGIFTIAFSFCSRPNGILEDGQGAFVAANGDRLQFSFEGNSVFAPPSTVNFTSFATFAGGTGRFENAAGSAVITGNVDVVTGAGSGGWDGTISFPVR